MVCMSVPVGGEIGEEIHTVDQVLTFTSGSCKVGYTIDIHLRPIQGFSADTAHFQAIVNGEEREVGAGDIVIVPAGTL